MEKIVDKLLEVKNLGVKFRLDGGQVFEAVKGISFDVPKNATVALVGESGSGKSVSAMSIVRLLPKESAIISPESQILFEGRDRSEEHTSELQSLTNLVCRLLLEKKKNYTIYVRD